MRFTRSSGILAVPLTVILEYVNHLLNLRVAHLLDLAVDAGCAGSQIAFCGFFKVDRSVKRLIEILADRHNAVLRQDNGMTVADIT